MGIISYAQNFEDVILWRALKHIRHGVYIDVGAQHPVIDSVSKLFYDHGWRGIHVEPTAVHANLLRAARPDETVVQSIVFDTAGVHPFYEIPDSGMSTLSKEIAEEHLHSLGTPIVETLVTAVTLDDLLTLAPEGDIHWLKVDVEGAEYPVFFSWKKVERYPWIIVVEATHPNTTIDTFEKWEFLILKKGYRLVFRDGLNRYYLHNMHKDLEGHFEFPANVFDDFQLGALVSERRDRQAAESKVAELQQIADTNSKQLTELTHQKDLQTQLTQEVLKTTQLKTEEQLHQQLEKERLYFERLQEQARLIHEQEHEFVQKLRGQEHGFVQKLHEHERGFVQKLHEHEHEFAQKLNDVEQKLKQRETYWTELLQSNRDTDLAMHLKVTTALQEHIEALQCQIEHLRSEHQTELSRQIEQVQYLQTQITHIETSRDKLQGILNREILYARYLSDALGQIQQSWFWKLSAPLRYLFRWKIAATDSYFTSYQAASFHALRDNPSTQSMMSFPLLEPLTIINASKTVLPLFDATVDLTFNRSCHMNEIPGNLHELLSLEDKSFMEAVYQILLGREIDESGLEFYINRLNTGYGKSSIIYDLAESKEAKINMKRRRFPSRSDDDFLRRVYIRLLWRLPDEAGLAHYKAVLERHHDRKRVIKDIEKSSEARTRRRDLNRLLQEEKLSRSWLGKIASGERLERRVNVVERQIGSLASLFSTRMDAMEHRLLDTTNHQMTAAMEKFTMIGINTLKASINVIDGHVKDLAKHMSTQQSSAQITLATSEAEDYAAIACCLPQTERVIYYFVDHTVGCPINTGLQRLVRQLGKSLLLGGSVIKFVKWNPVIKQIVLVNQADLGHLARWNGPRLPIDEWSRYPADNDDENSIIDFSDQVKNAWLVIPEVTHVTNQESPATLDVIVFAKAQRMRLAFIYYDAIPLRLPEYSAGAREHEKYMQALLMADLLLPISEYSAEELRAFFMQHQHAEWAPKIVPLLLPGESLLTNRVTTTKKGLKEKVILVVGSIEPRKNQLTLIEAFERFSQTAEGADWRLVIAGNLGHPDMIGPVHAALARNDRIELVSHPMDKELDAVYQSATFTVFPSVEEGFGLPILESLWYGIPCICANFGAMKEVAEGGGCLMINTRSADEIYSAILRLATDEEQLKALSLEALRRPMTTWAEYATLFSDHLTDIDTKRYYSGSIYYWVNNTVNNLSNSGIQRVVRQLAKALIRQNCMLIPVKWEENRLVSATHDDLKHLAKWHGPQIHEWAEWVEPEDCPQPKWLFVPELVHGDLPFVREIAKSCDMRCAAIFYDAIPYRMQDTFDADFVRYHTAYMEELANFDKVFSISQWSHNDLKYFFIDRRTRIHSFDHRFKVLPIYGMLDEQPRVSTIKTVDPENIHILSVVSMEPRKNSKVLLEAFSKVITRLPETIKLTVVGRRISNFSETADEMEQFVLRHPNVIWLQNIDDEALLRLYDEADFTVFPSLEEGFGLPIVESLRQARPCIAHHDGAMAEVGQDGGCILVDMRNSDELADAIVSLATSSELYQRVAKEAIERAFPNLNDYVSTIRESLAMDRLQDFCEPLVPQDSMDIYDELPCISKRPLLSICISTYNRGPWLAVNLRNMFNQAPAELDDVEFLVVDNTSTDNTEEVIQPYLHRKDFRFVRNKKNVGMLGNLRLTAHEARGEYIWIVGDDDLLTAGTISRIVAVLHAHRGVALVYPNYGYTLEKEAENVGEDINAFLDKRQLRIPPCPDDLATVKAVGMNNENLFTAIYALIFRRDHALRAYTQHTSARAFSVMQASIPTTYYVLNYMMEEEAFWLGGIMLVVNFNVSWNQYAALQILERVPEAQDLAERLGSDPISMNRWRETLYPALEHYWREIYEDDPLGNVEYFSAERVLMRFMYLDTFPTIVNSLIDVYKRAYEKGHPAASIPVEKLFSAFLNKE